MGTCPTSSFGTNCPPWPFPKINFRYLTIPNTSSQVRWIGFVWWSSSPLKCFPFFLRDACHEGIDDALGTQPSYIYPNICTFSLI
jgi:hypothetical protein